MMSTISMRLSKSRLKESGITRGWDLDSGPGKNFPGAGAGGTLILYSLIWLERKQKTNDPGARLKVDGACRMKAGLWVGWSCRRPAPGPIEMVCGRAAPGPRWVVGGPPPGPSDLAV